MGEAHGKHLKAAKDRGGWVSSPRPHCFLHRLVSHRALSLGPDWVQEGGLFPQTVFLPPEPLGPTRAASV